MELSSRGIGIGRRVSTAGGTSPSEVSAVVTRFHIPTLVKRLDDEPATVYSADPSTDWRTSVVVRGSTRMLRAPAFTHAAAAFGACAPLIASMMHVPLLRSRTLAPAQVVAMPQTVTSMPAPARLVAASDANEARPRWLSPRLERLGVSQRWRAAVIGLGDRRLLSELQNSVGELWIGRAGRGEHDAIILGVSDASDLAQLSLLEPSLKAGGVLWVLRPVNDVTITRQAIKAAARDTNLSYLASTRLTSTAIAEKLVRQGAPRART